MVEVEITGIVTTAQYGTLSTGDILRTTPEFAKHLVEDCNAARFRAADEPEPSEDEFEISAAHADPAEGAAVARRVRRQKS
jgi:hypothetical protein